MLKYIFESPQVTVWSWQSIGHPTYWMWPDLTPGNTIVLHTLVTTGWVNLCSEVGMKLNHNYDKWTRHNDAEPLKLVSMQWSRYETEPLVVISGLSKWHWTAEFLNDWAEWTRHNDTQPRQLVSLQRSRYETKPLTVTLTSGLGEWTDIRCIPPNFWFCEYETPNSGLGMNAEPLAINWNRRLGVYYRTHDCKRIKPVD